MRALDNKFSIDGDEIRNTRTGEAIPRDEPVFLLRARDYLAVNVLTSYLAYAQEDGCSRAHLQGIADTIQEFSEFQAAHPERMKQPGSTLRTPDE